MDSSSRAAPRSTVDASEVARFAALAERWWDPDGPMKPLHRLNPTRVGFVRDRLAAHFGRQPSRVRPLRGLALLDLGCGAGLLAEPMARLGATVVGIDAAEEAVGAARHHAREAGLAIDYRTTSAESLVAAGERYDAVLAMEVVEHVADRDAFLAACCALVRPGGVLVVATLNRTLQALAFAVIGAEYVLRWLEPGTHDWRRFVRPAELARGLRRGGVEVREIVGLRYNPLTGVWALARDPSVNYMALGVKEAA